MTSTSTSNRKPARAPGVPRPQPTQKAVNVMMRGLLKTPVISGGVGKALITIYAIGRKTGRRYSVPVAYEDYEGKLLVGTGFGWARNLRTGEPVDIRYKGKRVTCDVEVFTSEEDVTRLYAAICRANKTFASFNNIRRAADGEPDAGDLHAAWAAGARAFLLTPRS